jgi:acetyltransferase-like isoleucine patch superfamily enzyme
MNQQYANRNEPLSRWQQLAILLINAISLLHLLILFCLIFFGYAPFIHRLLYGMVFLYLWPPCAASVVRMLFPIREKRLTVYSKEYFVWWTLFNLQVLFIRMPFFEEFLRIIPGLYSIWLRLWGAKIGRLVYWAPGTTVLDRSFLDIGDHVILGAGVRINPHVQVLNEAGENELLLASITIGGNSVIGGYSLLTSGTVVAPGENLRAFTLSAPFSHWQNGGRLKKSMDESA